MNLIIIIHAGLATGTILLFAAIGEIYAEAADYNLHDAFTAYEITGEASDWLTTQDIPSFTVELTVHDEMEWEQNLAGMLEMLDYFGD